jgi:hypothetical protein
VTPAVTVTVIDVGVLLKQLNVGASNDGLGLGAGLGARGPDGLDVEAPKAKVLMAISAASLIVVFVILLLTYCCWLFRCDCWAAALAAQEKFSLQMGGLFLTSFSENCGPEFLRRIRSYNK